jgi:hypothetical protein
MRSEIAWTATVYRHRFSSQPYNDPRLHDLLGRAGHPTIVFEEFWFDHQLAHALATDEHLDVCAQLYLSVPGKTDTTNGMGLLTIRVSFFLDLVP